ncbi:MAG: glutamate formimidoyltransferase [Clostridia bacterium]
MNKKIVECVPNFSEGKNIVVIEKIIDQIRAVKNVTLLDYSSDEDHNRTVVTFVGTPEGVLEAAFNSIKKATELIDMENHQGGHPRMGATDVVPFIPVDNVKMSECVKLAETLGQKISKELNIPIYLYENAARKPERQNLSYIRKGEYEGFKEKIKLDKWKPDFGEAKLHPTAGATVVGARPFLVAYNVNLDTSNIKLANRIARKVRESSGGLANVKAMGVKLEERNIVQVSMNLTNYKKTAIYRAFEMVKMEARRYGVNVVGSEIIGLLPMDALVNSASYYLQLEGFKKDQVLEKRL